MSRTISAFDRDKTGGQDIRLDSHGNLAVAANIEDIRQRVVEHLRWELGEWFVKAREGVPYQNRVFGTSTSVGLAASVITEEILKERGVVSVIDVEAFINFETRRMTYRAHVVTDSGSFGLDEVIG